MKNMIDITGADLVKVVQEVYELSRPQGLGYLHFEDKSLSDVEAGNIAAQQAIAHGGTSDVVLSLDYVKGRACKFTVWRRDGRLLIRNYWFDHSKDDLDLLLIRIGVKQEESAAT